MVKHIWSLSFHILHDAFYPHPFWQAEWQCWKDLNNMFYLSVCLLTHHYISKLLMAIKFMLIKKNVQVWKLHWKPLTNKCAYASLLRSDTAESKLYSVTVSHSAYTSVWHDFILPCEKNRYFKFTCIRHFIFLYY